MGDKADKAYDVTVIGDCNPDIILRGDDVVPEFAQHEKLVAEASLAIGGSASITACACAGLGLRARFVGCVGEDLFGAFVRDNLEARGVDTSMCQVIAGARSGFTVVLNSGGDRALLTFTGAIDSLALAAVPFEGLVNGRHVHIGSYFLQPRLASQLAELVPRLRAAGVSVSIDPNWDPSGRWDGGLKALLRGVDLFFPNSAEAQALTGTSSPAEAAMTLADGGALVVVKDGAQGAVAAHHGQLARSPGFAVPPVDTTGAGDAFDAGFLRAWLDGSPLELCLAYACATGALSTRELGGTDGLPTFEAVKALVEASP